MGSPVWARETGEEGCFFVPVPCGCGLYFVDRVAVSVGCGFDGDLGGWPFREDVVSGRVFVFDCCVCALCLSELGRIFF